ncbi:hypothetical protein KR222_001388, partial [Zaprionus bogoriensis]
KEGMSQMANEPTGHPQHQATSLKSNVMPGVFPPTPTRTSHMPTQTTSLALDQYRLQLYNYALSIERFRFPPYGSSGASMLPWVHPYGSHYSRVGAGSGINTEVSSAPGGNRLAALSTISLLPQSQRIFQQEEPKPQHSYIGLIAMAILSSAEMKLVLSDIYQYILDNYPYFRTRGPGWRNSIRHNLSLNDCFIKSGRSANGKGHYWAIHPANMDDFRKGDFRRRKAQRKVRKHMGLSVDEGSTDSPSPPPLDLTSTPPPARSLPSTMATSMQLATLNYPYNQQYIGQFFGRNAIGNLPLYRTTATATALQRAHIQHQAEPAQQPKLNDIYLSSPQHLHQQHQHIAYINSTTTTTIANLYSETRKRQFDVASLLAPDVQIMNFVEDEESSTQTVFTKVQVQKQQTIHRELLVDHSSSNSAHNVDDTEADADIDVDGDGDLEEDQVVVNNSYLCKTRRCSFEQESFAEQEPRNFSISVSPASDISQNDSNSLEECPQKINSLTHPTTLTAISPPTHLTMANNVDPHIFSRYYGTYMAAAARQASLEVSKSQPKTITTSSSLQLLPN